MRKREEPSTCERRSPVWESRDLCRREKEPSVGEREREETSVREKRSPLLRQTEGAERGRKKERLREREGAERGREKEPSTGERRSPAQGREGAHCEREGAQCERERSPVCVREK
ncbi:hypothetical protein chiPu_0010918 [Chiloscyllium punctatum]|uniref:Uncharacterized protein n=1 Tax=Chiloscyllium punctatum TaxID=137246 RepID=A0A401SPZ7_CHIPU|nr:hypothetical protein [Chiloscyllium punctatum]